MNVMALEMYHVYHTVPYQIQYDAPRHLLCRKLKMRYHVEIESMIQSHEKYSKG